MSYKLLETPTGHSAKCATCHCTLSGKLPRIYFTTEHWRYGIREHYICPKCIKRNDYASEEDKKIVDSYFKLINSNPIFKDIITVDEL